MAANQADFCSRRQSMQHAKPGPTVRDRASSLEEATMKSMILASGVAALALGCIAASADFPERPLRLIVASPPGGGPDVSSRLIGSQLTRQVGQQVVVENRTGGSGVIGMEAVARATPDGYTFGQGNFTNMNTNRILLPKLPYNPDKDLQPLIFSYLSRNLLAVNNALPITSVPELIAYAKRNPGKLMYGAGSVGSSAHFSGALFCLMAGIEMMPVPYKAASLATTDVIGGQIHLVFDNINSIGPHVKAGRLRGLAVTSLERSQAFPNLPSVAEAGVPGFEVIPWAGFVAPAGVPKTIVARLNAEINKVLINPTVREKMIEMGLEPRGGTPEEFTEHIRRELAKWSDVAKRSNIRL
jgi:tripartite-type tricarboxylate transporter receptor subunit TctC